MRISRRLFLGLSAATAGAGLFHAAPGLIGQHDIAHAQSISELMAEGALPEMVLGSEDAPVTIIEYASMTCGHCADFHNDTLPAIKKKYIDTGKARLIFREFPLDSRAFAAFMLARCADERFYFPMVDVLFKQQDQWARAQDPRPPLLQIAKLAGFTQESFEACLQNSEVLDSLNAVRTRAAEEFGVNSTPTFFINGTRYTGNKSVAEMSAIIDDLL